MGVLKTTQDLVTLMGDLSEIEANKLLLWATIYTRKVEEIKEKKLKELKKYFDEQIAFYKRSPQKYAKEYEKLYAKYEESIDKLYQQYNVYYQYIQNENVFAQTNQKIAIANFVVSKRAATKAKTDNNIVLEEKSNKKVFATAQKKLNYDVVINECSARLEKCMEDTYTDMNKIFDISSMLISVKKEKYLDKFFNFFKIKFAGEKSFKEFVLEPLKARIDNIEKLSVARASEVKIDMLVFIGQMEKIRSDINLAFNETLNKN